MQRMRECERDFDFFCAVYLFLSSLHDCIVWIELSQLSESYGNVMPQYFQHTKCGPKDVTFDLKSSNPWILHSFCFIACYVRTMNIFRFQAMARSLSIRCHANLLKKKKFHTMSMAFHLIHEYPVFVFAFPKKKFDLFYFQKYESNENCFWIHLIV